MPDQGEYCPFLNRAESRCGEHFSLEGLSQAFEHCFGRYAACPVYHDLLLERRQKRTAERIAQIHHGRRLLIQLCMPARQAALAGAQPAPGGAAVPAVSGV